MYSITRQEEIHYVRNHCSKTLERRTACVDRDITSINYTLDHSPTKMAGIENMCFVLLRSVIPKYELLCL